MNSWHDSCPAGARVDGGCKNGSPGSSSDPRSRDSRNRLFFAPNFLLLTTGQLQFNGQVAPPGEITSSKRNSRPNFPRRRSSMQLSMANQLNSAALRTNRILSLGLALLSPCCLAKRHANENTTNKKGLTEGGETKIPPGKREIQSEMKARGS